MGSIMPAPKSIKIKLDCGDAASIIDNENGIKYGKIPLMVATPVLRNTTIAQIYEALSSLLLADVTNTIVKPMRVTTKNTGTK